MVLLSGGLDSTTVLAIARAKAMCRTRSASGTGSGTALNSTPRGGWPLAQGVARHVVADIDLRVFGGSALTDDIDVPRHDSADDLGDEIPVTYVPARNTVFLSFALGVGGDAGVQRCVHRRQRTGLQRLPGLPARVHRGLRARWRTSPPKPEWKAAST